MSGKFERYLSHFITHLLAIVTSLAFLVLPSVLLYIVLIDIKARESELIIGGIILFAATVIYNVVGFLSTKNSIDMGKSKIEKAMGTCLRIGGFVLALGVILTVFVILADLLESASKM